MHTEILAAQAGHTLAKSTVQGPHFIQPTDVYTGIYGGKTFYLACVGEFENSKELVERIGLTNLRSCLLAEIVGHLIHERERKDSFVHAFADALHEVYGLYAVVATWNYTLVASCTPAKYLVAGHRESTMYIASDPQLIEQERGVVDRTWVAEMGGVFRKDAGRPGEWIYPLRRIHQRLSRAA